jgi:hypothetical protein
VTTNYFGAGYPAIPAAWPALAFVGISCLYLVAVGQGFRFSSKSTVSTRWLLLPLLGALLPGGALLFLPVVLSPDIQSYIAGSQAGAHYYAFPPAAFQPATSPVLYGPAWLAIASVLAGAGSYNPLLAVWLFRGLELLAHLANISLIWAILARIAPGQRLPGTLLYAWNPLVLAELAVNGHYDGLVICLLLLAAWLSIRRNSPHPVPAPVPVGARVVERRGAGLYGRPPVGSEASSPKPEDAERDQEGTAGNHEDMAANQHGTAGNHEDMAANQHGTAGDHKGPPHVHPTTLAPTGTGTGTRAEWLYEIGALALIGLAISMNWLALVIAPLFLWFMGGSQRRSFPAMRGLSWRAAVVLIVVVMTYLPIWQGGTTFLAITSSIDLLRLVHSPLALIAMPLRLLYTRLIAMARIPSYPTTPILPASAADLTIAAPALFIFALLYFRQMGSIHRSPRYDTLFTGLSIVMTGFVGLASATFWPWYLVWVVWLAALRPFDVFSKTLLLLSCAALLYYPLLSLDTTPFAFLMPLCIFGIPFVYFVGARFIAPWWIASLKTKSED